MTENKRFTLKKNTGTDECYLDNLYDNNTFVGAINSNGSELICYLLNAISDENEELKQFKKKVFNIINKKLKDNEELDGVDTAMYYANRQTLNELKKELFE